MSSDSNAQHAFILETLDTLFAMAQAYVNAGILELNGDGDGLNAENLDEVAKQLLESGLSLFSNLEVMAGARALAGLYTHFSAASDPVWAKAVWSDFMETNAILRAELWEANRDSDA